MHTITPAQSSLQTLLDIIARLRGPDGCPWDRAQTKETLRPYLLEEAYEVLDAIDLDDPGELCEELGDLLLQIVLLCRLHEETGDFDFAQVCTTIGDKLIRRHPHVFADAAPTLSEAELEQQWQQIKARERSNKGRKDLGRVPALPALVLAEKTWPTDRKVSDGQLRHSLDTYLAVRHENTSARCEEALAEVLFALVGSAREGGLQAEKALRRRVRSGPDFSENGKT